MRRKGRQKLELTNYSDKQFKELLLEKWKNEYYKNITGICFCISPKMMQWLVGHMLVSPRMPRMRWGLQHHHSNYCNCAHSPWPWCWSTEHNKEKKKNPVMVHLIFKEFFHKKVILKFLLSVFPCLSVPGIAL